MGSRSQSQQLTEITTTTSTDIGEIGLTGDDAVAIVSVIEGGAVDRAHINANLLSLLAQEQGEGFNRLVGGANNLLLESGETSRDRETRSFKFAEKVTGQANAVLADAQKIFAERDDTELQKVLPIIGLAIIAVAASAFAARN